MSPEMTALVVIVTLILQTWYQRWVSRGDKEEVKAAAVAVAVETKQTAQVVTDKLETVHKAVNGEGIGGKLDTIMAWQAAHDAQDNQRYDELVARIAGLKSKPE